jgi:O-methyltransferase
VVAQKLRAAGRRARNRARATVRRFRNRLPRRVGRAYATLSYPITALLLLMSRRIHPDYAMSWPRKARLAWRMWRTTRAVATGTSPKAHLAMAVKLLETPPEVEGVVVECGSFLGGSTANLSLACEAVGRRLVVYDSFEGLPAPAAGDKYATEKTAGAFRGELETVRSNVSRFGAIDRCSFRKGWFSDTLPRHGEPIVLCFLDVDYQASLHECVVNLWPHLTPRGYVFIDEYVLTDYCALFWSERYWREYLDTTPPGLLGSGTGIGVGQIYPGPREEGGPPFAPTSVAYTRKDLSGHWDDFRDAAAHGAEARAPR